jgi:phosphoribosylformimino-5-aminoimidazole carboxamide ribotide isomerase
MLIPSIDLMGGKIVQLVQGEQLALEFQDFEPWIERFSKYPLTQLIDLDAARQTGHNRELVTRLSRRLPCQVGGGIRSAESAHQLLRAGAQRVIIGSALIKNDRINMAAAKELAEEVGSSKLTFAIDSRGGRVAIEGWRKTTGISPLNMIDKLQPHCDGFLYTHIDTEGLMQGIPMAAVQQLRKATTKRLAVAGGISTKQEVDALDAMNVDAVVGMAIYTGRMDA